MHECFRKPTVEAVRTRGYIEAKVEGRGQDAEAKG